MDTRFDLYTSTIRNTKYSDTARKTTNFETLILL